MARYSKIILGPARKNDPQVFEAPAAAAGILPGSILVLNSSGEFAAATAALDTEATQAFIAQKNYLALKSVETAYGADDRVIGLEPETDVIYALRLLTGMNVSKGDALCAAAGGAVDDGTATGPVVAYAHEDYNNDTGSTQLIAARPLR